MKYAAKSLTGKSKSPSEALFQRFKELFELLSTNLSDLNQWDWPSDSNILVQQGKTVQTWVETVLSKNMFAREDYRELAEMICVFLGGELPRRLHIRKPGADHHARFMAKAIYFLKIYLLSKSFFMTVEEKHIVDRMALFIGLFYGKYLLESSLIPCAPANDLQFYISMVKLKAIDEDIASSVIKSIKRHLDYLTEENVIFSLFDENLSPEDRSNIAKILFVTPRPEVFSLGKPKLPQIDFNKDDEPHLSLFVGSKSWLLFNKLGLFEKQEWLNLPCDYWHNFTDFRTAKDFVLQINTTNDSAERGVKLITDFKNHCCDEVEREYLSQVIEQHRQKLSCQNL